MASNASGFLLKPLLAALAAAAFGVPFAASAQSAAAGTERVIVSFRSGAEAAARDATRRAGGRIVVDLREDGGFAVELSRAALAKLRGHPAVRAIEPDLPRRPMGAVVKRARSGAAAMVGGGEVVPFGIPMVQADQLSLNAATAPKLCIVDSGYDLAHEDLPKSNVTGANFSVGGDWSTDEDQHGTHVAGTIAALGGNGLGVVGVVPGGDLPLRISKVFPGRLSGGSTPSSVILKGVRDCVRNGAKIVSMSLGGAGSTDFEARAYQRFADKGVLVIAAAGNAGDTSVSYPAGYAAVMSVAAIDAAKAHAGFSQVNDDVEIAAPGVDTLSTVPMGSGREATLAADGVAYLTNPLDGSPAGSVTAPLFDFGTGEASNPGAAGKVCVIARGNISFADKVLRCQADGGVGAVIYNNAPGGFFGTLGGVATTIPSVSVSQADGAALLAKAGVSATVNVIATNYAVFQGTSMATPHVSGVAALVWSRFPACSAARIRQALNASAEDLGAPGRDATFGHGLVQAKAAADWLTANGCAGD